MAVVKKGKAMWIYGTLALIYLVLMVYELYERKYCAAAYWLGALIIQAAVWGMR